MMRFLWINRMNFEKMNRLMNWICSPSHSKYGRNTKIPRLRTIRSIKRKSIKIETKIKRDTQKEKAQRKQLISALTLFLSLSLLPIELHFSTFLLNFQKHFISFNSVKESFFFRSNRTVRVKLLFRCEYDLQTPS